MSTSSATMPSKPPRKISTFSLRKSKDPFSDVESGLKHCYGKFLKPFEESCQFSTFHSPALSDADFSSKPLVLLIGQYSTGKTTFIRYLIESDYPGIRIGPEPTTDNFNVIMHNQEPGIIPGNALVVDSKYQFKPLARFGNTFLNRFQCSQSNASMLESLTLIDTPGVLSGEKQRVDRGYDYVEVLKWFAARVDRVIILFDANKLDISDELRRAIQALKGYDEKIRVVLNKADSVDSQQLMRVYGALMWNLGKVFNTPEVARVYIGSFWDQALANIECRELFKEEQNDLFDDIRGLPRQAALRKLNDFIKRARSVKIQALILSELSKKMPMFGRNKRKRELIKNLEAIYKQIQDTYNVSSGDFPDIKSFKEKLTKADFKKFKILDPVQLAKIDKLLSDDVAKLMEVVPQIHDESLHFNGFDGNQTPFGKTETIDDEFEWELRHLGEGWLVANHANFANWKKDFEGLRNSAGKVSAEAARTHLMKSKLPSSTLSRVWLLSDIDNDGSLTEEEFCLALFLIQRKLEGKELPKELPEFLIPSSPRSKDSSRDHEE